jgi:hypothetical protein
MVFGDQERDMMGQEFVAFIQVFAATIVAVMSIRLSGEA